MKADHSANPADLVDEIVATWRTELPELDGLVLQLAKRAARLTGLIDAVTVAELDRLGRTKADYEVLSRLRAAGVPYQLKPHELASELLLSSGGTTNVLHRLTAAGLLVRHADRPTGAASGSGSRPRGCAPRRKSRLR